MVIRGVGMRLLGELERSSCSWVYEQVLAGFSAYTHKFQRGVWRFIGGITKYLHSHKGILYYG